MSDSEAVAGPAPETAPSPASNGAADHFGAKLRAAREAAGMSASELAQRLRLHVKQIEALERADLAALPTPIYVRGFLRGCARELKIDAGPLLADLDRRAGVSVAAVAMPSAATGPALRFGDGSRLLIVGALVLLAIAFLIGILFPRSIQTGTKAPRPSPSAAQSATEANNVPSLPTTTANAPAAAGPVAKSPAERGEAGGVNSSSPTKPTGPGAAVVAATPKPTGAAAPAAPTAPKPAMPAPQAARPEAKAEAASDARSEAKTDPRANLAPAAPVAAATALPAPSSVAAPSEPPGDVLVFRVHATSWVEVRQANGAPLFSQICLGGTEHAVRGTAPLTVVVGNAGAVDAEFRGAPINLVEHANANGVARLVLP